MDSAALHPAPNNNDDVGATFNDPVAAYRYERKFATDRLLRWQAEDVIRRNHALFLPLYHPRWVNNIYFDTPDWSSYRENVDGCGGLRMKVRVRWYGSFEGPVAQPMLELKIRNGYVNRKRVFPLAAMTVDSQLSRDLLCNLFRNSGLPDVLCDELQRFQPVLGNRYWRSYFQSADGNFRTTVDSELTFYPLRACHNLLLARSVDTETIVVELKYSPEFDLPARAISRQFPFRLTRSSKYASGIERVAF